MSVHILPPNGLILFLLLSLSFGLGLGLGLAYSETGVWEESAENCDRYICTPSNLTWKPTPNPGGPFTPYRVYDNVTACQALKKKGIKMIFFSGDSYMRQLYAATLITLSGDFKYGSIKDPVASPQCEYNRQFYEKKCGTHSLNHYAEVCNGEVTLDPILHSLPFKNDLDLCSRSTGTVIIWSFGNYNVINGRAAFSTAGRRGVNNATEYKKLLNSHICPSVATHTRENCSLWWASTHYRLKQHFPDEAPEQVKAFNEGMHSFFTTASNRSHNTGSSPGKDPDSCKGINYVDLYNMTAELARHHREEAEGMTYDHVHWGMEVNMVKAQILLNALLNS